MPVNFISDDNLRAALRPYRVDPEGFEAGVRKRVNATQRQRVEDPLARLSPLLRYVAAFLPLQLITGCKMPETAARAAPAAGASKLVGYLAFPAISLFVLVGATVFSITGIRNIRDENSSGRLDQKVMSEAITQWWRRHKWGAWLVFGATFALAWVGATWLMFLFYIISFGLLLYFLTSFARLGLGNRQVIASSCISGLVLLAQIAGFPGIGADDIHFVDQQLIGPVFFGGVLVLMPLGFGRRQLAGVPVLMRRLRILVGLFAVFIVALSAWLMNPILWPATPSRIKGYVESFKEAPFASSSWRDWEIVARWAVESKLNPDLSGARRLLAQEIAGEQDPFVIGSALRLGLVRIDQLGQLKDYESNRHSLLDAPYYVKGVRPILSLSQYDWVIRASVLRDDLSPEERDHLEKRLLATLEDLSRRPYDVLETALRVTQLLEVIQRPIDRDRYRDRVHDWLRQYHSKKGGGFQVAGGFRQHLSRGPVGWARYLWSPVGSVEVTAYAVELMEIYGTPADLDLNWVRSFVRPLFIRLSDDRWIAAVTRDRLNHLPGVRQPTWLEVVYHERSLIAAAVLVGLCIYATLCSPEPKFEPEAVVSRDG
jgi:hypothetical protein